MKKTIKTTIQPKTTDMTQGNPLRLIVLFAIPLMLSNICQQLYNVADSLIVGRLLGVEAFAAVGAAFPCYWLFFSIVLGFSQGFGVLYAQRFGAGDHDGLRDAAGNSLLTAAVILVVLMAAGIPFIRPMLSLIGTPAEIMEDAVSYMMVLGCSLPVFFLGNVAMSLLRSLGNSRAPLFSMVISSVTNIVLDIVFVAVFGWGVAGAAAATVVGAACSLIYCVWQLTLMPIVKLTARNLRPSLPVTRELMRLGTPVAFQSIVISIGMIMIQAVINGYGTAYIAGVSAAGRYFGILNLVGFALDGAIVVYVGQNYGAGSYDRIRTGVNASIKIALVSVAAIAAFTLLFGRQMIALFITAEPALLSQISEIGYRNLSASALCLPFLYLLFIYRSSIQGMGNAVIPMISGFAELAARLCSVLLLTRVVDVWGVYFADGLSWVVAGTFLGICYYIVYRKRTAALPKS